MLLPLQLPGVAQGPAAMCPSCSPLSSSRGPSYVRGSGGVVPGGMQCHAERPPGVVAAGVTATLPTPCRCLWQSWEASGGDGCIMYA